MPIYAFACSHCGHAFDRLMKMSDADPTTCPHCGQEGLTRQVTAPHVRLAGKGWYETDFKAPDQQRHVAHPDSVSPSSETSS